jgi:hypothetical protein
MRKRKQLLFVVSLWLALYVDSYVWLSRRPYARADEWHVKGFWYFSPENSAGRRVKNYGCVALFWPLNAVDRALGLGRGPACEPLGGLSK